MPSTPDPVPAGSGRGRHRAPSPRAAARRAGLLGILATVAAGGATAARLTGAPGQDLAGTVPQVASLAVRSVPEAQAPARLASRAEMAARADRSKRPARPLPRTWTKPVAKYTLSSRFGARWGSVHHGLDFACPIGTPVRTVSSGTVTQVRFGAPVYGVFVDVRHTDGSLTRYGHLSRVLVAKGTVVTTGRTIALSGNAGRSTGPHLHLEVHPHGDPNLKDAADPAVELRKRGVKV